MSIYDEPTHLSPEQENIETGEREYSDEEMKAFQHGTASPFMKPELIAEIIADNLEDDKRANAYRLEEIKRLNKNTGFIK